MPNGSPPENVSLVKDKSVGAGDGAELKEGAKDGEFEGESVGVLEGEFVGESVGGDDGANSSSKLKDE